MTNLKSTLHDILKTEEEWEGWLKFKIYSGKLCTISIFGTIIYVWVVAPPTPANSHFHHTHTYTAPNNTTSLSDGIARLYFGPLAVNSGLGKTRRCSKQSRHERSHMWINHRDYTTFIILLLKWTIINVINNIWLVKKYKFWCVIFI